MEPNGDAPAERLFVDDEHAKARIMSIDLGSYDDLVTYPAGIDWPIERKKILFLRAAISLGFPWSDIVSLTAPHFGQTLYSGFEPLVAPITPQPFAPPAFDVSRQTVGQWAAAADEAWKEYRAYTASGLTESRRQLIQGGALKEFERSRQTVGVQGQKKAHILDERATYTWSALYFFAAQFGAPLSWSEIAANEPLFSKFKGTPSERAKLKRKVAEQIRTNVIRALQELSLPVGSPE